MNLEEAINLLKQEPDFSLSYYKREYAIDLLLKAYEKQQKEIEELKEKNKSIHYNFEMTVDKLEIAEQKIKELLGE